jgi:hypothetical protein
MAWTATLRDKKLDKDHWDVSVTYTDGVTTIVKGYALATVTDAIIKDIARNETAKFTQAAASSITVANGAIIDLTPPTPPVGDPAKATFLANLATMQSLMKLVDMGILSSADSQVTTLRATLKSQWLPAYLSDV